MQSKECLQEGWYLLKTRPRQEQRAQENLEIQGFDAYCPHVKTRYRGEIKEEVLFPSYLFLYLDLKDLDRYHKIRSTRGVNEIVYFNRITRQLHKDGRLSKAQEQNVHELLPKPIPNGHDVIEDIKLIVQTLNHKAEGVTQSDQFREGDKVIMNHPLYKDLEMTFVSDLGAQRGMILVQYIKQQRTVEGAMVCNIVTQKKVEVRLKDLEKAQ